MSTPAWHAVLDRNLARHDGDPAGRRLQLATVGLDGAPAVRTVIYRGRHDGALLCTSDARAAKLKHIAHEPRVELAWYFPATGEQVRVAGKMEAVLADTADPVKQAARRAVWRDLSPEVRASFLGGPPGRPLDEPRFDEKAPPPEAGPPPTFALLVLWPERVDHVELDPTPHRRTLHARDAAGRWHARAVHP